MCSTAHKTGLRDRADGEGFLKIDRTAEQIGGSSLGKGLSRVSVDHQFGRTMA